MLPSKLKYSNKVNSSYARNFQSVIDCQNTSNASCGSTSIINLPCVSNQFMSAADSLLSFKMTLVNATVADTTFCRLNRCGAAAAIQRLRIFHGSTLLQDLDIYNQLNSIMTTYQCSRDAVRGKLQVLQGTDEKYEMDLGIWNEKYRMKLGHQYLSIFHFRCFQF
jgi:hypothetical protein